MTGQLDIGAYLTRIGYSGPIEPTLPVLRQLQGRHLATIAFETIASLTHAPIPIDLPAVQNKVLRDGRGGYCWELNRLYRELLRHFGFDVRALSARVVMGLPETTETARTHLTLLVTIDGTRYITDVGFGGMTPPVPLHLDTEDVQETTHEPYRITRTEDGRYTLRAQVGQTWNAYYVFDLATVLDVDHTVANWYVATHPNSAFRGMLIVARTEPGLRRALRNGDYAIHRVGVPSQRRTLADAGEVVALLRSDFGIAIDDTPEFRAALLRVLPVSTAA